MSCRKPIAFLISRAFLFIPTIATWPAYAQSSGYGGYGHGGFMHGGGWGGGWLGMFLGPLMMLIFLAIATAVIVLIVRWVGSMGKAPHHGAPTSNTPLDILKERFARGEIEANEFEERRKLLEK
jgi:putative membrane protein